MDKDHITDQTLGDQHCGKDTPLYIYIKRPTKRRKSALDGGDDIETAGGVRHRGDMLQLFEERAMDQMPSQNRVNILDRDYDKTIRPHFVDL